MKDLMFYYKKANKKGFALGAFNFSSLEGLKAICAAAENQHSPVIIAVSEGALSFMGGEYIKAVVAVAKKQYKAPIFLHLDHGKSFEVCKKAIALGFDSVMIDASSLEFNENVALTKKVVKYAHQKGIFVEDELGQLKGVEDNVSCDEHHFTDPAQAKLFVEQTGVDSLAVAIGTSHGAYKFSGESKLRFDILSQIENALPKGYPLVLHGASSVDEKLVESINALGGNLGKPKGVDENLTHIALTKHNVVKINTDTDLRIAFTEGVRRSLTEHPENFDQRKYLKEGMDGIQKVVERKMQHLLNSSNQA